MSDDRDGYASTTTAWESGVEPSDLHSPYDRPVAESADERASSYAHHPISTSPQHRSSLESQSINGHSKSLASHRPWRDNTQAVPMERRDISLSTLESGTPSLVEPTFDENVLRALCELDVCIKCSNDTSLAKSFCSFIQVWCATASRSNQAEHGFMPSTFLSSSPYVLSFSTH